MLTQLARYALAQPCCPQLLWNGELPHERPLALRRLGPLV
jgi:hypothetical protein